MKSLIQIATLLAAAWATAASELRCELDGAELNCRDRGLIDVPSGYWPEVEALHLDDNPIPTLYKRCFTAFPSVVTLRLHRNRLTYLELDVLGELPFVKDVSFQGNPIHTVEPAPAGVAFNYLEQLHLSYSQITSLDPDVLLGAPNLGLLNLLESSYVVPASGPILNHPTLHTLNLQKTDASALNAESLQRLPNLQRLLLYGSGVSELSGVFHAPLRYLDLAATAVQAIAAGTFPKGETLYELDLSASRVERVEASALSGAMPSGARVLLGSTPLACSCAYESLHWWALGKGVAIQAPCGLVTCAFTGRRDRGRP